MVRDCITGVPEQVIEAFTSMEPILVLLLYVAGAEPAQSHDPAALAGIARSPTNSRAATKTPNSFFTVSLHRPARRGSRRSEPTLGTLPPARSRLSRSDR